MQVMIFDDDVHHGNGTNDLFHSDPSVLFVSTHQQYTYPGTGKATDVGSGDGEGFTINMPLPGAAQSARCIVLWSCSIFQAEALSHWLTWRWQPVSLAHSLCDDRH